MPQATVLRENYEIIQQHKLVSDEEMYKIESRFSDNALRVMKKRYLLRNDKGELLETPGQMLHRIAHVVAAVEKQYGKSDEEVEQIERDFFDMLANKEFTPAGRTITNAGAPSSVVANCIVLPIEDSMEGIFKTLKDAALLQKAGSGLGFSFGRLRPAGSVVKASQGMASGPVSFLQVYNQAFGVIKQQGRHGANMAILPVDHPDILDFIHCKEREGEIRNFNISVGMTDEFMNAVINTPNEPWMCQYKGEIFKPRRITRDRFGVVVDIKDIDITAKELYTEIMQGAWNNGEPGVVFLDTANKTNTQPLTPVEATNPCGEQFLPPYDVCNLGSINLAVFVKDGKFDQDRLINTAKLATRFLDNVIDLFDYPVQEVQEMSRNTRRVGLGIMGFADLLYQLKIRYDSVQGFTMAQTVMGTVQNAAHEMSVALADEKGEFPHWPSSTWAEKRIKRRNTMVTTIAPTGSISMFFDTSSGCEPNFALAFTKQDKDGHTYKYVNAYLQKALDDAGVTDKNVIDKIIQNGSVANEGAVPFEIREVFRTAMDISAEDHIRMQAAFQKHVENSITKTINFPNEATLEDIESGFILAWQLGCKGGTFYRDGSRNVQVLNLEKNLDKAKSLAPGMENVSLSGTKEDRVLTAVPRRRPEVMKGATHKVGTAYGSLYVTVNEDDIGPFEVFALLGKAGGFFATQTEAVSRLISLALRSGIKIEEIIDQIKGIRGPDPMFHNGDRILSLPDAIAKVLVKYLKNGNQLPLTPIADNGHAPACPDCGASMEIGEGCMKCPVCGFSKCG